MHHPFTDYVRSLAVTGESDPEGLTDLWPGLRRLLRREIRRRGLWESPPSYLGVYGWERWSEGRSHDALPSADRPADALDELVADGYTYVFIQRLHSLRAQLRLKPNVDGLVVRSVRNFLHDTQKRCDPFGFRVFSVVKSAVRRSVQAERLHVLDGAARISNETVLGFRPAAEPDLASDAELGEIVPAWNDHLLPDLVTARGSDEEPVLVRLEGLIAGLPAAGIEVFRFRDLLDPLKVDARARWAARFENDDGETGLEEIDGDLVQVVRLLDPDTRFEDDQTFGRIADCVAEGLERVEAQKRTRDHLAKLWYFLETWALERDNGDHGMSAPDEMPSNRQLAELLDIPRRQLSGLFATLGDLVSHCRETTRR